MDESTRRGMIHTIETGRGLRASFLPGGTLHSCEQAGILLNQYVGDALDGGPMNLWLRVTAGDSRVVRPLLGPHGPSAVVVGADSLHASGTIGDIDYELVFCTDNADSWFWRLRVGNCGDQVVSVEPVYVFDVGLAASSLVRRNEYYVCQYIDATILEHEGYGPLVCSRHNMATDGRHPWLMSGCRQGAIGVQTDGSQFFGSSYVPGETPAALAREAPLFGRKQGEFSAQIVYAPKQILEGGDRADVEFFSRYLPDHPEPTQSADLREVPPASDPGFRGADRPFSCASTAFRAAPCRGRALTEDELHAVFPGRWRQQEKQGSQLLSFFCKDRTHVVLPEKEQQMPKTHGAILRAGMHVFPEDDTMSAVAWMRGVFASHVAVGATCNNRFIDVVRGQWNVQRASGVRLFVQQQGSWRLLDMPSAFAMEPGRCSWIYQLDANRVTVTLGARSQTELEIDFACEGPALALRVFVSLEPCFRIERNVSSAASSGESASVRLQPLPGTPLASGYPDASFSLSFSGPACQIGGDERFFGDGQSRGMPVLSFDAEATQHAVLTLSGRITDLALPGSTDLSDAEARLPRFAAGLEEAGQAASLGPIAEVLPWFLQNALIHFSCPHGLEQYSGGGWGVRDVAQGPVEALVALGQTSLVRRIVCELYAHQYGDTGDWPQFFLYDRYGPCQSRDSHGDIVVWTLKALCDYTEATGDLAILSESLPFATDEAPQPLWDHIARQIACFRTRVVGNTALLGYGHGDWNDSLQPADPSLPKNMVSAWTVELLYQSLNRFVILCERAGKRETALSTAALCEQIRADFERHLVHDDLVAGFGILEPDGAFAPVFHPQDKRTGIEHRLLPCSRGILSEIFSPEQAKRHAARIHEHLLAPDGARLFDRPVRYLGGATRLFQRAETATFWGREIGLQYVHAHLRYAEAMAKLGRAEDLLQALLVVNPVGLCDRLPSAGLRQTNAYFSSSDADFADRYEVEQNYKQVMRGEVTYQGGWRVYSSGPGMYIGLVRSALLGLRRHYDHFIFDPVLATSLGELVCDTHIERQPVQIRYQMGERCVGPSSIQVNGAELASQVAPNPYRDGGLAVSLDGLLGALCGEGDEILVSAAR